MAASGGWHGRSRGNAFLLVDWGDGSGVELEDWGGKRRRWRQKNAVDIRGIALADSGG